MELAAAAMASIEEDREELLSGDRVRAKEDPKELEDVVELVPKARRSRSRGDQDHHSSTTKCRYGLCTFVLVLLAAVLSLAVGLFLGQSIGRKAVSGGGSAPVVTQCPCPGPSHTANNNPSLSPGFIPSPSPSLSPSTSSIASLSPSPSPYNWGDTIVSDGTTQNVTDYFAARINETDIRNYLA